MVLYGSIALLITLSFRRKRWVKVVWLVPVVFAAVVGWARVYRGMHHVSDVLAGSLLGIGSLLVATIATRASAVAADRRASRDVPVKPRPPLPEPEVARGAPVAMAAERGVGT